VKQNCPKINIFNSHRKIKILDEKCIFIAISFYRNVFLSEYCASKCLVWIRPYRVKFFWKKLEPLRAHFEPAKKLIRVLTLFTSSLKKSSSLELERRLGPISNQRSLLHEVNNIPSPRFKCTDEREPGKSKSWKNRSLIFVITDNNNDEKIIIH